MKYNIAIVEDNEASVDVLLSHIEEFRKTTTDEFDITVYNDGDEIIDEFDSKYDIIFLDVEMRRMDGMRAAEIIRKYDQDVIIIFITNMSQYAIKGYKVNAMSFLLKPLPYFAFLEEFKKSLEKVKKQRERKYFLIPDAHGMKKVASSEIIYIESIKHELLIVTNNQKLVIRGTLKSYEEQLLDFDFNRCNNSYLVNLAYVTCVEDDFVCLGGVKLKISRPRKKQFMESLTKYLGAKR